MDSSPTSIEHIKSCSEFQFLCWFNSTSVNTVNFQLQTLTRSPILLHVSSRSRLSFSLLLPKGPSSWICSVWSTLNYCCCQGTCSQGFLAAWFEISNFQLPQDFPEQTQFGSIPIQNCQKPWAVCLWAAAHHFPRKVISFYYLLFIPGWTVQFIHLRKL